MSFPLRDYSTWLLIKNYSENHISIYPNRLDRLRRTGFWSLETRLKPPNPSTRVNSVVDTSKFELFSKNDNEIESFELQINEQNTHETTQKVCETTPNCTEKVLLLFFALL